MKWLWAALLTSAGIVSAQAYTCTDVRALSQEKQAYYIKVLNITPVQQERIRRECYGARASTGHVGHRPRDARRTVTLCAGSEFPDNFPDCRLLSFQEPIGASATPEIGERNVRQ